MTAASNKPFPPGSYENRGETFKVQVEIPVSQYDLSCILTTAFEGGVNYWCDKAEMITPEVIKRDAREVWNEYIARNLAHGGQIKWHDYDTGKWHVMTREMLLEGIRKWALLPHTKFDLRDGTLDTGDVDSDAADLIVQLALFNEVIYG